MFHADCCDEILSCNRHATSMSFCKCIYRYMGQKVISELNCSVILTDNDSEDPKFSCDIYGCSATKLQLC